MNCFSHKFFTTLCFGQDIDLIDSCILPDEDEAQNGFSCHFYNPVTGKCYLGTEDSAKNRFIWHLVDYLISKNKEKLGRAIHYLEDMCTPVHTQYEDAADAIIRLKMHIEFEKKLDHFLESGGCQSPSLKFHSVSEILSCCPCDSSSIYFQVKKGNYGERELGDVYSLVVSALSSLKEILDESKNEIKILGKTFLVDGKRVNVLFENDSSKGVMLPASLNPEYALRFNGVDNIVVYKKNTKFSNFHVIGNIF